MAQDISFVPPIIGSRIKRWKVNLSWRMRIFVHCIDSRTETFAFIYGLRLLVRLITKFTSTSIQVYTTCEYNKRKQHRLTPPSNKTMSMMSRLRWDGRLNVRRVPAAFPPRWWGNRGTTITRGRICARKLFKYLPKFTAATRDISLVSKETLERHLSRCTAADIASPT